MGGACAAAAVMSGAVEPLLNGFGWVGPVNYHIAQSQLTAGAITLFDIVDGNADCVGGNASGGTPAYTINMYLDNVVPSGGQTASLVAASDGVHTTVRVTGLNAIGQNISWVLHVDVSDSATPPQTANYSVAMSADRIS